MNERLSLQDLIDILAKKQDITKKDAEAFLRELVAVISDTIEGNESVKIKDFGVFKLVKVSARKSVDVNTGEAIEIPPHYKLSFTPDRVLKEAINRPFSHFESVVLEEGLTFENIEEEKIEEPEATETVAPVVEEPSKEEDKPIIEKEIEEESKEVEPVKEEDTPPIISTPEEEANEIIDEEIVPEAPEWEQEDGKQDTSDPEEDSPVSDNEEEDEIIPSGNEKVKESGISEEYPNPITPIVVSKTDEDDDDDSYDDVLDAMERKSKRRKYFYLGAILFLIIAGFVVGGLYFQEIMRYFKGGNPLLGDKQVPTIVYEKSDTPDTTAQAVALIDSVGAKSDDPTSVPEKQDVQQETKPEKSVDKFVPIATETIVSGQTLRLISLKHYGHRSFWPYILQENKDVIKNPNSIPLGTKIVIPAPAKYGIDAKDPIAIEKAKKLESKVVTDMGL